MATVPKGSAARGKATLQQPRFDDRIYRLAYPLAYGDFASLQHGYMIWDQTIRGFSDRATVHFLYNPSDVEADYPVSDSSIGASLLFPVPGDRADLRVPLSQTVSWSLLYDRTYELWGAYDENGKARQKNTNNNNPSVIGVGADIYQLQQFTGMTTGYDQSGLTKVENNNSFAGHQGIIQLIPSWVFFGNSLNLSYYGYISEWDVTVTHWTQYMVPMRCEIDVYFTMLPPPSSPSNSNPTGDTTWGKRPGSSAGHPVGPGPPQFTTLSGISGR
jgi:hypothetical protein